MFYNKNLVQCMLRKEILDHFGVDRQSARVLLVSLIRRYSELDIENLSRTQAGHFLLNICAHAHPCDDLYNGGYDSPHQNEGRELLHSFWSELIEESYWLLSDTFWGISSRDDVIKISNDQDLPNKGAVFFRVTDIKLAFASKFDSELRNRASNNLKYYDHYVFSTHEQFDKSERQIRYINFPYRDYVVDVAFLKMNLMEEAYGYIYREKNPATIRNYPNYDTKFKNPVLSNNRILFLQLLSLINQGAWSTDILWDTLKKLHAGGISFSPGVYAILSELRSRGYLIV